MPVHPPFRPGGGGPFGFPPPQISYVAPVVTVAGPVFALIQPATHQAYTQPAAEAHEQADHHDHVAVGTEAGVVVVFVVVIFLRLARRCFWLPIARLIRGQYVA